MAEPAPADDRCCMGGFLDGERLRCWGFVPGQDIWCPTCRANIDHDDPQCECPGCQAARAWGRIMSAQRDGSNDAQK